MPSFGKNILSGFVTATSRPLTSMHALSPLMAEQDLARARAVPVPALPSARESASGEGPTQLLLESLAEEWRQRGRAFDDDRHRRIPEGHEIPDVEAAVRVVREAAGVDEAIEVRRRDRRGRSDDVHGERDH